MLNRGWRRILRALISEANGTKAVEYFCFITAMKSSPSIFIVVVTNFFIDYISIALTP